MAGLVFPVRLFAARLGGPAGRYPAGLVGQGAVDQVFVALDLEMTGPQVGAEEIIEIAAVKFRLGRVLDSFSTLVNPERALPLKIQRLTGIDPAALRRAPTLDRVIMRLVDFIGGAPIVGQSIGNDLAFLAQRGIRLPNQVYDTFDLATLLLHGLPSYRLTAIAEHLGVEVPGEHRATTDALVSKNVFERLFERAMELDLSIIQAINELAKGTAWPLASFFQMVERERARAAFQESGTSLRARLQVKGPLDAAAVDLLHLAARARPDPLEPAAERTAIDPDALAAELAPGGAFERIFPGFEHRPQQVEMLRAVADTLNAGDQLVVEAGTGTGKSLAYLLPAAEWAVRNGERVVISTATINLQDQLFTKDIPDLQRVLPAEFRAALVKGRGNYLCLRRYAQERRQRDLSLPEITGLVKLMIWLSQTESGDRAELNLSRDEEPVWGKVCATVETCTWNRCVYLKNGTCFLHRARREAEAAHIVVVNHSLLLSDVAANSKVLPDYRYLIVDEAHHLEAQATDQLGYSVSERSLGVHLDELSRPVGPERWLGCLNDLRQSFRGSQVPVNTIKEIDALLTELHAEVQAARAASHELFGRLRTFAQKYSPEQGDYNRRLRLVGAVRGQPEWAGVGLDCERLVGKLIDLHGRLERLRVLYDRQKDRGILNYDDILADLEAHLQYNENVRVQLEGVLVKPREDFIYWIETGSDGGGAALHAVPLSVGDLLQQNLFQAKEAVVLTSATLSAGGRLGYVEERLGLDRPRELIVGSPFDYRTSTAVLIPNDIPEPNRPGYQAGVERAILEVCTASEGRALVLFTSNAQLRQTFKAIEAPLRQRDILVLGQGIDGTSRRQLLANFKANPRTVLLGSASFWEGVDVVGEALSVLIITKLPFPVPSDPVFAARSELFDDAFNQYSVPQTILKFKQGFGRLIRSRTDRGVLVLLDRRVQTKTYGPTFLKSLPPCAVHALPSRQLGPGVAKWLAMKPATPPVR